MDILAMFKMFKKATTLHHPLPGTEHTNLSEPLSTNFYFHVYQISYPSQGPTPQPPTPSPDISPPKNKKKLLSPPHEGHTIQCNK